MSERTLSLSEMESQHAHSTCWTEMELHLRYHSLMFRSFWFESFIACELKTSPQADLITLHVKRGVKQKKHPFLESL